MQLPHSRQKKKTIIIIGTQFYKFKIEFVNLVIFGKGLKKKRK